ncbi:MAG: winged helix-turn-helix domain-containing protein [Halobacteriales archaeon]
MSDSSPSRSPLEAVLEGVDTQAIEAFELLSHEARLAILLALWEAYDPSGEHPAVPFSELAERINYDSPGNLNYHLDKLTDHYVRKTGDGYHNTEAGNRVVRAVRAGAITRDVAFGPFDIDGLCPYCGAAAEVSYADTHIMARCTECTGTFIEGEQPAREPHPEHSRGIITRQEFPPAGVQNRDPEAAVGAHLTRTGYLGFSMLAGTCPECAGRTRVSTTCCPDHDAEAPACESCGRQYAAWTGMVCGHCRFAIGAPSRWLPIRDPRIGAFFQERGVDVTPGFSMELWSALDRADERIVSEDPVELAFTYRLGEDELPARVAGDMTVLEVGD